MSHSTQVEEMLMEHPCLYDKCKMSYKERDVCRSRNTRSRVAEKLDFIQNSIYKCEKPAVHLQWPRIEELG